MKPVVLLLCAGTLIAAFLCVSAPRDLVRAVPESSTRHSVSEAANKRSTLPGDDASYTITEVEKSAGVTPANLAYPSGDGRRYGIVPNDDKDDAAAMYDAMAVAMRGVNMILPEGTIDISASNLSFGPNAQPFSLRGAGRGKTTIRRAADVSGAFLNFKGCTGVEISDMTIDAGNDVFRRNGSHALRMDRCSDVRVERIEIRNWTDTAIIAFDSTRRGTYFPNIHVSDVFLDGLNAANNGILFSFTRDSSIRNCEVRRLGKSGSPAFALQFKSMNKRGVLRDCVVENARAGIAVGSDEVPFPSNIELAIDNIEIHDTTYGLHLANSRQLSIRNIAIDLPTVRTSDYRYGVTLERVDSSELRNVSIHDHGAFRQAIRIRNSDGNTIEALLQRGEASDASLVVFEDDKGGRNGSDDNDILIESASERSLLDIGKALKFSSKARANRVKLDSRGIISQVTIVNGNVRELPEGVGYLVVDTEASTEPDELHTVSNGSMDGQRVTVSIANDARSVVLKHGSGNLRMRGGRDRMLRTVGDSASFEWRANVSRWVETE